MGAKKKKDKKDKKAKDGQKDKKDKKAKDHGKAEIRAEATEPPHVAEIHVETPAIIRTDTRGKPIPLAKSVLHEEDQFEEGHTAVWGSVWERAAEGDIVGRWGYACCRVFKRRQPCPMASDPDSGKDPWASPVLSCQTGLPEWESSMMEDRMDADAMDKDAKAARKRRRSQQWQKIIDLEPGDLRQAATAMMSAANGAVV